MHVPLIKFDLPPFEAVESSFREILTNGRITNFGKYVQEFEQNASDDLGGIHCVTLSSGTMGLLLTLQALGLKDGQKVILPNFTFMATGQAIRYDGGTPILAEVTDDAYDAACGSDFVVVLTEWEIFRDLDLTLLARQTRHPVRLDMRNLYEPEQAVAVGWHYYSGGREKRSPVARVGQSLFELPALVDEHQNGRSSALETSPLPAPAIASGILTSRPLSN